MHAEDALNSIAELENYYTGIKNGIKGEPSEMIDKAWHAHILNTPMYFKFSDDIFGKYLHHKPGFGSTEAERKVFKNQYQQTLDAYTKLFGAPPAEYWPVRSGDCATCDGCDVGTCTSEVTDNDADNDAATTCDSGCGSG